MKSLKEFLAEDVTQVHGHNSVMGQILARDVHIPLSDSTLRSIEFNPPEVVGYHIFSPTKIDFLMRLQGSKKGVSIFLNYPGQYDIQTGIEGGGGAVAVVKGKPVLSTHTDAYTEIDSNGRRWVSVNYLTDQLRRTSVNRLLKSQVKRKWVKEFDLAQFKGLKDFVSRKASEALHEACKKSGIFEIGDSLSDEWWAKNAMRPPFEGFRQRGSSLQRGAITETIRAMVGDSSIVSNKQKQIFIKTYLDALNKTLSRYKRQVRVMLFPVMYSTSMDATMHRVDETVVHSIQVESVSMFFEKSESEKQKELIQKLEKHSSKYSLNLFGYETYRSEETYEKMKRHAESFARSIR